MGLDCLYFLSALQVTEWSICTQIGPFTACPSQHTISLILYSDIAIRSVTVVGGSISVLIVTLMDPGKITTFGHGTLSSTTRGMYVEHL